MSKKIAILSTGNELIIGDLLNTDAQYASRQLDEQGIEVGMHMVVSDKESDIVEAITFLLKKHEALLITGGLGPTSDDKTRFGLAKAINQPLELYEPSLKRIKERLEKLGLPPVENNHQQALFPKGAQIFKNEQGTADGCSLKYGNQLIYMLPGPPHEFQPLFDQYVLPELISDHFPRPLFKSSWLLLNVSEGHIAHQLDNRVNAAEVELGYRVHYPYLELKLRALSQAHHEKWSKEIQSIIHEYVISTQKEHASLQLKRQLRKIKRPIHICDEVTGGLLEHTLLEPENRHYLNFHSSPSSSKTALSIIAKGFDGFWEGGKDPLFASLTVSVADGKETVEFTKKMAIHTCKAQLYAMENICWLLLNYFRKHHV